MEVPLKRYERPGMVAPICSPSYIEGRGRRLSGKTMRPYVKNKLKQKD
jgi:hypothetical protein